MGDRLEKIEDEIFSLGEAIEYLGRVRGCEDVIEILEDKVKVLSVEREQAHRMAEYEDDRNDAALSREYARELI